MMFSLPDFSVKRPVRVFICLVSLILFGVSSVFEMPLESTPEMNMPTMTIMTSYPDASPDEVDEMVTQKIESALSGITEVESMTSTSSEGSSMIMLEFGYDVDTDDKYQDITSALASMLSALTLVPLLFVKMRPREKLTSRSRVMMHALEGKYEALLRRALRARKTVVASAIACTAIAGFLFTQIDMELMPAGSTNTISVSVETRSGLDLENTNAIMEEIESMISEDPDVESYSLRVSGGGGGMGMMGSSSAGSVSITLKDDASVDTDTYVQNLREKTSGLKNCSVEVSKQESMSFGSSGVELRLSGPDLGDLETASESIRKRLSGMEEFDSVSTSLTDGSPRAKIEVDPVLSGA